jgi:hypothetical protein
MVQRSTTLVLTLLLLGTAATNARAQQDTASAPVYGWVHSLVGTLTATQVAFTDWAQGGENALAWAIGGDGKSTNEQEQTSWTNSYKLGFGQTRLGDQGIRKTDDRVDLESMLTYKLGGKVNPYAAATLKTQFAKGYKYDAQGASTAVSQFFDPAFLTQTVGVVYQPITELKTRFGVGLREILTSDFPGYADDPATAELEKTSVRGGLESVTEFAWKLDENVGFSSKLEMFSAFKKLDEVIVRSDNTLSAKVSKYITVLLNLQLLNEKAVSPRTQVKETLSLGLSYSFL